MPPLIYGIVRRLSDLSVHTVDGHCVRSTLLWSSVPLRDVNILFKCTICQIQVSNGPFILVFSSFLVSVNYAKESVAYRAIQGAAWICNSAINSTNCIMALINSFGICVIRANSKMVSRQEYQIICYFVVVKSVLFL